MSETRDSYNRGGFIAFVFSMVFSLVFFVYLTFLHPGIDLKEVPQIPGDAGLAVAVAGEGGSQGVQPANMADIAKPWEPNEAVVAHGLAVYKTNCAVCHGNEGKGDGPAGMALQPPPRNLITGGWKKGGSSAELYATLVNGLPGTSMASFAHLPKGDRWALVQFVRSITKDKPADDPAALEKFAVTAE